MRLKRIIPSASALFFGCALLTWFVNVRAVPASGTVASGDPSLRPDYERVIRDLEFHFWDPDNNIPRIRPTRGANSTPTSCDAGTIDNWAKYPSFWEMAQFANIQYWQWRLTGSPLMREQIRSQWRYIRSVFSDRALCSSSWSDLAVYVSDDAAWEINYLVQVHEVTGDRRALDDAVALLPNILKHFSDPNAPAIGDGTLRLSTYGILYAVEGTAPEHASRSSSYEIMIADAALYIYGQTHDQDYLNYAIHTYNWMKKYMKHPKRGYYYCELDLRPTVDGVKNPHYLVPIGDYYGPPVRGLSSSYSGGTMAMAVCASRLYKITGEKRYLTEAQDITARYVGAEAFLRPGNIFVNERDAFTDGHWAPYFADEVLPLDGVDPSGLPVCVIQLDLLSRSERPTAFMEPTGADLSSTHTMDQ